MANEKVDAREQAIFEQNIGNDTMEELLAMAVKLRLIRDKVRRANAAAKAQGIGGNAPLFTPEAIDAFLIEHSNGCKVAMAYFRQQGENGAGCQILMEGRAPASASVVLASMFAERATAKLAAELMEGCPTVLVVPMNPDADEKTPSTPQEIVFRAIEQGTLSCSRDEVEAIRRMVQGGPVGQGC